MIPRLDDSLVAAAEHDAFASAEHVVFEVAAA
jgi:hypothetical protein